jgi:predicted porin
MKKILLACILISSGTGAIAQSSVTLFGIVDATLQYASQNDVHVTRLNGNGGLQSSRIGFRGIEDLGGGLSAGFHLEAGVNVDSGAGAGTTTDNQTPPDALGGNQGVLFNRRATVSLLGGWGELRLGRDNVPAYQNIFTYDPFGASGAGSILNIAQGGLTRSSTIQTALRASNSIGYFLPSGLAGFYGQAMYALGENASNAAGGTKNDGNYAGLRIGYAAGPFSVGVAYGKTSLASGDVSVADVGGVFDFGFAKAMAQYFRDSKDGSSDSEGWMIGGQINLGSGYFPIAYSTVKDKDATNRTAKQLAAGYVYNMSKRTALYGTLSYIKNEDGANLSGGGVPGVANEPWRAVDLGIRHSF